MRTERGFTLLEVLVAFIIAALALAVLFQGAVSGLVAARTAGRYQEAVALARSHLATLAAGGNLIAREVSGDDGDGFHWSGRIAPAGSVLAHRSEDDASNGTPPLRATLFAISVTVSWKTDGSTREVRLETARLATGPAGGG